MPLKLIPPRQGKSPYFYVRGTHRGVSMDRSTKETVEASARKWLRRWKDDIDRGEISRPGDPTFLDAAVSYMASTGQERFLQPVIERLGSERLDAIDQAMIDSTAIALYPMASAPTRNRQVYTPVSSVLKHAGVKFELRRPKGWRGSKRTDWCQPEQAFRIFDAARGIDPEFEAFLIFLCYTGARLSDALDLRCDRLIIGEGFAYFEQTKNDDPRGVHLPPVVVAALANHPRGLARGRLKVFRFRKCGRLYTLMDKVKAAAGADVAFVTFHTFCHTWATWMRRYAGLDTRGLVGTGRWRDEQSAARYEHVVVSEEARKADLLPTPQRSTKRQSVENPWKPIKKAAK